MPDAAAPVYRPMTEADVSVTAYVRKAALEGLDREQGREPPPWQPFVAGHFAHMISTDPGGSWVAEMGGLPVGYAQGFVRGDIWFLAQLFVQPEVHGMGVGQELLRRAMDYGRERGARVFSVVASLSPAAQALYMRAGMFGIGIGYRTKGMPGALLDLPAPPAGRTRVLDGAAWVDRMAELDRELFGAPRREDHQYYLRPAIPARHWFGLAEGDTLTGYGYVDERGWIGPIAAREPEDQLPLLGMAAGILHERGVEEATTWVVSLNHVMVRALLRAGFRGQAVSFFLASEPFGKFDRYHPSGGLLL